MQISFLKGRHSLIPIALVCVLIVAGSIVVGSQWVWIANASAPITECDRLAAHPLDKHAVSPGINTDNLDASKAVVACRVAVKEFPDERRFKYQLARALAKDRTTAKESFSILLNLDPTNYPAAATTLGYLYADGLGVEKNNTEAVKWYRKAAEQGYAGAQANLGVMYENGRGVKKSSTDAVTWFRKAAEKGDARAQNNLAIQYINGQGVERNLAEALKWMRMSADQGYKEAQTNLVKMRSAASSQGSLPSIRRLEDILNMDSDDALVTAGGIIAAFVGLAFAIDAADGKIHDEEDSSGYSGSYEDFKSKLEFQECMTRGTSCW